MSNNKTSYLILRKYEFWDDKLPIYYLGEKNKNKDMVHIGAKVIIEKELGGEIKFLGYAEIDSIEKDVGQTRRFEYSFGQDRQINEGYNMYFKNYVKFQPPRIKSNDIRRKLNLIPEYHWYDTVRPLTKEMFYEIVDFCSEENWRLYLDEIPSVYPANRPIDKLLLEDESEILEFKSSMLHAHNKNDKINAIENQLLIDTDSKKEELKKKLQEAKNEQSRFIIEEIIIAIASFLNSRGGTLLIGIDDNKKIIGINYDYPYLPKNNWDGWLLYLKDKLKKYIKVEVIRQLNINPYHIDGKTIVRIDVPISPRYVFVKIENSENFYIRYFNSSNLLKGESMVNYIIDRWKDNKI